ncbi:MAG TPA: ROK family protein, partial [Hyphomicrobiaceae bacterium]|nr:ROK family protein [Hyphomicrobiaceae bacterium]
MNATHADVSSSGHANKRSRIGIDLGGTKIAGVRLGADDEVLAESRMPTPRDDYAGTLSAIAGIVERLDSQSEKPSTVGIAMPGSIAPGSGCVQNANSTWLNGYRFQADAASALERPVRCANDANCFVLSETLDGSAAGANSAFGVIVGTGCG